MSRSTLRNWMKSFAPLLLASIALSGCGSGSSGSADTGGGGSVPAPAPPVTITETFDFSAPAGYFVVGDPPLHARFSGGVAENNGAWIVQEGETATVNFATPADSVTFSAKDNYVAATAGMASNKTAVGAAEKVDPPFDVDMFLRGQIDDDWAASPPAANKFAPTATDNVLLLKKNIDVGTYNFKVADAGWSDGRNCGGPGGPGTVVVGTAFTTSCANATGNDLTITIAKKADYNITFNATGADKNSPTLTFAEDTGDGGGEPPPPSDSAEIRIYSRDVLNPDASETVKTIKGTGTIDVAEAFAGGGEPHITRIEIENLGTNGDLGIENFQWTANPQLSPAKKAVDVYYRRPSGGYASTSVTINGAPYTCVATTTDAYGCVVKGVQLYPYEQISLSVTNGAGAAETIVTNADTATQPVYAFSGVPEARVGAPGETGKAAAVPNINEIMVFYKRSDDAYTGWGIHLFPKDPAGADWTTWAAPLAYEGVDPEYGAYFRIKLPQNATPPYSNNPAALTALPNVLGFILHNGDTKDPGPDQEIRVSQDGNMVFVVSGINDVSSSPQYAAIVKPVNYAAHWVLKNTVLWQVPAGVTTVDLLYSPDASLINNANGGFDGNYATVRLTTGTNPNLPDLKDLASYPAFALPAAAASNAAAIARSQIYIVGRDAQGAVKAVTRAQTNGALDDIYYAAAKDVVLGPSYSGGVPSLKVWAPTALLDPGVSVQIYNADGSKRGDPVPMTLDPASGVWSVTGQADWDQAYYTYQLKVYTNFGDTIVTNEVSDPYAVSGSTDGAHSAFINLDDTAWKPTGWDDLSKPALAAPEDIVVYELHVRDFSIADPLVPLAHKGKYTAFDITGTHGRQHLEQLVASGLTHVHVLPAFDIATVIEDAAQRVDIDDPVQKLCDRVAAAASLCFNPANGSKPIRQLMAEYAAADPASLEPQQITEWMRSYDGFNWGYDPYHFGSPEGSYSTNPNGGQRVLEFRHMVKGLSEAGLRTVMDVVYNHTSSEGQAEKSVFDKVVPGYYHRRKRDTGDVTRATCCSDIATEFKMAEKVMFDTGLRWIKDYKIDGFRFDLMTSHTKEQMVRFRDAAKAINPALYIYGEGWNSGPGANDTQYVSARQDNMAGTGIGTFNDRIRDAVRGGGCCDTPPNKVLNQGIISGQWYDPNAVNSGSATEKTSLLTQTDRLRAQLAGGIKSYLFVNVSGSQVAGSSVGGYTEDPSELINYIEKHDNETLWDISQYKHPAGTPATERVRAQNVGTSMVLLAQGVPFIQAGQDILRSKSMDRNSYDSGDWFNELDWTLGTSKWGVGLPLQGDNQSAKVEATSVLQDSTAVTSAADRQFVFDVTQEWLKVRKSSQLFRLRTADQIKLRMKMLNTGPDQQAGVVAYRLDGCSSAELTQQPYGAVVTIFNPTDEWTQLALFKDETFTLHPVLVNSVDATVKTATHDATSGFRVPPRTTAVYVNMTQTSCSPYGVPIFARGLGGDWSDSPERELIYDGGVGYQRTIALVGGSQQFKIADTNYSIANCGGAVDGVAVQIAKPQVLTCGTDSKNLLITPPAAGNYTFSLNAADKANPLLTVGNVAPYGSTTLYVRGSITSWDAVAPMTWDNLSKYRAEVLNVAQGDYQFKIADASWNVANCGATVGQTLSLGAPYPLTCFTNDGGPGNIALSLDAGSYLFAVNGLSPEALTLTVEKIPFTAALYVRGLNGDWSNPPSTGQRMSYRGGGLYTYAQSLGVSAQKFKIADAGWTAGTDCGTATELTVATALTLNCVGPGNSDINFAVPAPGRYEFSLNATNTTAPQLTVTGP